MVLDLPYEPQIGDEIWFHNETFWVSSTHYIFDEDEGKFKRVLYCIVEGKGHDTDDAIEHCTEFYNDLDKTYKETLSCH